MPVFLMLFKTVAKHPFCHSELVEWFSEFLILYGHGSAQVRFLASLEMTLLPTCHSEGAKRPRNLNTEIPIRKYRAFVLNRFLKASSL